MPQDDIDQGRPQPANLPSSAAAVMLQPQPMILDLQELLVEREMLRGIELPLRSEFSLRVRQHLFAVAQDIG
jgi:hypothetical protein